MVSTVFIPQLAANAMDLGNCKVKAWNTDMRVEITEKTTSPKNGKVDNC